MKSRFIAFSYPDYTLLWLGQLISFTGTQMQMVALNWQIYEITHSAFALGLIGFFRFVPIIFFSLIGGSVSDVHNRKVILYCTQISLGVLAAMLSILTYTGHITATSIYLITIFSAIATSFDSPARQALMPNLLPKEHLSNAMSLYNIMWQIASIAGPALAGLALATIGVANIYMLNALSFGPLMLGLFFIKNTGDVTGEKTSVSISAIIEGLKFVRSTTIIWSTMLIDFVSTFFASATSLIPLFAKDVLHVGPIGLGLLYAAPAVGAIVSGFLMAHKGHIRKPGPLLLSGVAIYSLGTILFGIAPTFILAIIALCMIGAGDSISTILRNVIRQLATPDSLRGRMTAVNMIFFAGGPQLGDFEAGLIASAIGGPWSVVLGGVATLLFVGYAAVKIPILQKYQTD